MSPGSSNARSKSACLSCTRRKVRCSKTIPCSNCVRRGEQYTCALEETDSPPASGPQPASRDQAASSPATSQHELDYLRKRVTELQAELQNSVAGLRNPNMLTPTPMFNSGQPPPNAIELVRDSSMHNRQLQESGDAVIENAASILEFLAWGRRKNPDYHTVVPPEATVSCNNQASGDIRDVPDSLEESSDPINLLQLLLPSRRQVWQLVEYHQECLLWYHGSYYGPMFQRQLEGFYDRFDGNIADSDGVKCEINLQWVALLFSVMLGSLTCSPAPVAQSWGFREPERELLSKRWFHAVVTCLNKAEYTANQSILSVQAISSLTISAHLLGYSNSHSIHLAAAVRIAQSLGLHRLTGDAPGSVVENETGRRVWSQLCSQDWFSIPFSESYLINPLYSQSEPPLNCHDDAMLSLPEHVPTITSYCRFLTNIASIMPQLQDGLMACNTAYTRYNQVLKWDKRLRTLATAERPLSLSNTPIEPGWPVYTPWARRALAISSSHKIIMIHRSFLSESFVNPAFAFTRRTCLAASKTIIKEYKHAVEEDGPVLWVHQAFSVAAAIILVLDVIHRDTMEQEYVEHKGLVEDVVGILGACHRSMIAHRGSQLLSALLSEISQARDHQGNYEPNNESNSKRRRIDRPTETGQMTRRPRGSFNVPAFVKSFCDGQTHPSHQNIQPLNEQSPDDPTQHGAFPSAHMLTSLEDYEHESLYYPPGLEGATSFENLLYLANYDFSVI